MDRETGEAVSVTGSLATALAHHRAGRLPEAERLYREVLTVDPGQAEAWSLLGVLAGQLGKPERAIIMLGRSLMLRPDQPSVLVNLGTALSGQRRLVEAEACLRRALALEPDLVEAHNHLGAVLLDQGRTAEAETCLRQALALRPDDPVAGMNLGLVLKVSGRTAEAEACLRRALDLAPDWAQISLNLGNLLAGQGRVAEAEACYRQALVLQPDAAEAEIGLGLLFDGQGQGEEAVAHCRQAVALKPGLAEAHNALGAALIGQEQWQAAEASLRQALMLRSTLVEAHNNLGTALQALGRPAEAALRFRSALALRPDFRQAHENLGMTLLSLGDYAGGFLEYQWRLLPQPSPPYPLWDGGEIAGRTLLLRTEQGLGDTLQFIRYARLVRKRCARVVLCCQPELVRLLRTAPGVDSALPAGQPWPAADVWLPLMSLPCVLGTTLDTVPAESPYLTADAAAVSRWADRLPPGRDLKVGLVWAGNPYPDRPRSQAVDRRRSLALAQLTPLGLVPGISLISLQKGPASVQALQPPEGLTLFDPMAEVGDFADTAALIASLDLVIGVDTAVIHLAGALGRPVWVLSRFDACWRWLAGHDDSPWYPTLRLFRQPAPGAWAVVIERVAAELAGWAAQNKVPASMKKCSTTGPSARAGK